MKSFMHNVFLNWLKNNLNKDINDWPEWKYQNVDDCSFPCEEARIKSNIKGLSFICSCCPLDQCIMNYYEQYCGEVNMTTRAVLVEEMINIKWKE